MANAKDTKEGERLQKMLSRCGVASRRAAEELITGGRIAVNGQTVRELGTRVVAGRDEVTFDGERIRVPQRRIVLVLNKPTGTLCSERDPEGRPLVHHLVPDDLALRSVGRLDFNTEGVLLMTNDGKLADRLSHARNGVQRVYEARVRGIPTEAVIERLVRGVVLDDGPARVEFARVVKKTDRNAWLQLALNEGRNREVRRLLERVGHPVMRLRRISFAGVTAVGLEPGRWRELSETEIEALEARGQVGAFAMPPDPRRRARRGSPPAKSVPATVSAAPARPNSSRPGTGRKPAGGAATARTGRPGGGGPGTRGKKR